MRAAACAVLLASAHAVADSPRATPPPAPPGSPAPTKEKKIKPEPPPPPSPPDPIVSVAQNANLESTSRHAGLNFTVAGGGGFTVGFGIGDSVGRGPGVSFRLAYAASERFAWTVELASIAALHQVAGTSDNGEIERDVETALMTGLQFYVNRTLWVRIAGGIGGYQPSKGGNLGGPAGGFGGGFDVIRFRRAAIGLEMMSMGLITRDGLLTGTAFMLALNIE
jgi:hypothetical protein